MNEPNTLMLMINQPGTWQLIMLDASIKTAALLLMTCAAILFIRRASAAAKHMVWFLAVAACLIMPLLCASLPQWRVLPTWLNKPAAPSRQLSQAPPPTTPTHTQRATTINQSPETLVPGNLRTTTNPAPAPIAPIAPAQKQIPTNTKLSAPQQRTPITFWQIVTTLYIAISALALLPLLLGTLSTMRLKRQFQPASEILNTLLNKLASNLGITTNVHLIQSAHRTMPMTFGLVHPFILIPQDLHSPRAVLLHELAHIKRRDCLTQFITHLACALYWFNPLLWVAAHRMRIERERACDDLVLQAGSKPSDYAQQLLTIAAPGYLAPGRMTQFASIAMARKSNLEGRMLAILDPKRNRKTLTRLSITLGALVIACIVVPIAMLRAEKNVPESQPAKSPYIATLDNGVAIELIGVNKNPSDGQPWWKPDGSPLAEAPYPPKASGVIAHPNENSHAFELAVRLEHLPDKTAKLRWKIESAGSRSSTRLHHLDNSPIHILEVCAFTINKSIHSCKVSLGFPSGLWQTIHETGAEGRSSMSGVHGAASFAPAVEQDGSAMISVAHDVLDRDVRLIAIDQQGIIHTASRSTSGTVGKLQQLTATFKDLPLLSIKIFHLKSRSYEWVEFRNVSLKPGQRTKVQAVAQKVDTSPPGKLVDQQTFAPALEPPALRFISFRHSRNNKGQATQRYWSPDGQELNADSDRMLMGRLVSYDAPQAEGNCILLWFAGSSAPEGLSGSVKMLDSHGQVIASGGDWWTTIARPDLSNHSWNIFALPAPNGITPGVANVHLVWSDGNWQSRGILRPGEGTLGVRLPDSVSVNRMGLSRGGLIDHAPPNSVYLRLECDKNPAQITHQFGCGLLLKGEKEPRLAGSAVRRKTNDWFSVFSWEVPWEQVSEFHIKTRPLHRTIYRNVSLKPGHRTKVQIVAQKVDTSPPAMIVDALTVAPAMPPPASSGKDNALPITWGKTVNGLQSGFRFEHQNRVYQMGENVSFFLLVRNTSDKAVTLADHTAMPPAQGRVPTIWAGVPTVRTVDGKLLHLTGQSIDGPVYSRKSVLKPGDTLEVGSVSLLLDASSQGRGHESHVYLVPGKYLISQAYRFADDREATWSGELTTGALTLSVSPAERITIRMQRDGSWLFDGRIWKLDALIKILRDQIADYDPKIAIIRDEHTDDSASLKLLDALYKAGIKNVHLPTVSLTGKVTASDGSAARRFVVYVEHEKWRDRMGDLPHEQTDDRGTYTFHNLPPGQCDVFTSPVGNSQLQLRVKGVKLVDGQTTQLDLNLQSQATISGRVTAADGKPISGAKIAGRWQSDDGALVFIDFAMTDDQGHYALKSPLEKATYIGISGTGKQPQPYRNINGEHDGLDFVVKNPAMPSLVSWGQPIEGVQVRLHAKQHQWAEDKVPEIYWSIRNQGSKSFRVYRATVGTKLEVDGQWYERHRSMGKSSELPPNRRYDDVPVKIDGHWSAATDNQPLQLAPGRHVVRIGIDVESVTKAGKNVQAISEPIEIEILEDKYRGSASFISQAITGEKTTHVWMVKRPTEMKLFAGWVHQRADGTVAEYVGGGGNNRAGSEDIRLTLTYWREGEYVMWKINREVLAKGESGGVEIASKTKITKNGGFKIRMPNPAFEIDTKAYRPLFQMDVMSEGKLQAMLSYVVRIAQPNEEYKGVLGQKDPVHRIIPIDKKDNDSFQVKTLPLWLAREFIPSPQYLNFYVKGDALVADCNHGKVFVRLREGKVFVTSGDNKSLTANLLTVGDVIFDGPAQEIRGGHGLGKFNIRRDGNKIRMGQDSGGNSVGANRIIMDIKKHSVSVNGMGTIFVD